VLGVVSGVPAWVTPVTGGVNGTAIMPGGQSTFTGTASSWTTVSATAFSTKTLLGSCSNPSTNNNLGCLISSLPSGSYDVEFDAPMIAQATTTIGNTTVCGWRFNDGTNTYGFSQASSDGFSVTNTQSDSVSSLRGTFNYTSNQTALEIDVQYERVSGSGSCLVDSSNASAQPLLTIRPSTGGGGNVSSASTGQIHIESTGFAGASSYGTACTSGSCNLIGNTGGISSVTFAGPGTYTVNFPPGEFLAAPVCTCNRQVNDGICVVIGSTLSTATQVGIALEIGTGAASNGEGTITCVGAH
jgi:hypothetical protein